MREQSQLDVAIDRVNLSLNYGDRFSRSQVIAIANYLYCKLEIYHLMLERIIHQLSLVIAISIAIVGMWITIPTVEAQAIIVTESSQNSIVLLADVGTPTTEAKPSLVEQAKTLTETTDEAAKATAKAEKKAAKAEAKKAKKLAKAEAKKAKELAKAQAKEANKLAKAEAKAAKTAEKPVKTESESES